MKKISCIIIGAGSRGKDAYAPFINKRDDMEIIGVAEPDFQKRADFQKLYNISDGMCFESYRDLFAKDKLADAVLICTMDDMHLEPAVLAMEKKYHILLEKPIAPKPEEVYKLDKLIKSYDRAFLTGYVLRYAPFFMKIKEYIDTGKLGRIVSVQHNENEGYWHHAHNYVRGPWNSSKTSSPLILAKSSHDMDLLLYLIGAECKSISSFGGNIYFNNDNAPGDAALRCSDGCKYSGTCKYYAPKLYTETKCRNYMQAMGLDTDAEIIEYLKTSDFDKCIYRCDNDIADHQVSSMEFEGGVTAVFTICAFTSDGSRTIKVMGTDGEIGGCLEDGRLVFKEFGNNEYEYIEIPDNGIKHGGGDSGIIDHFAAIISSDDFKYDKYAVDSHMLCFAAEESRLTGKTVNMDEYISRFK